MTEQLQPGDPVLVDGTRALRVLLPGPPLPIVPGGSHWLPGVVQRVRDDGWLVVQLAVDAVRNDAGRAVVAPPEAVRRSV